MNTVFELAAKVKNSSIQINKANSLQKNKLLINIKNSLIQNSSAILKANECDLKLAKQKNLSKVFIDRLTLNSDQILHMATAIDEIVKYVDPIGEVICGWVLPNGLKIEQVRVPLGVVGVIYEARPNVTVEAATVCLKAGNGVLLRGGSSAIQTNLVLANIIRKAIELNGFDSNILGFINDVSHESAVDMMNLKGLIDVLIPRGGSRLINCVVENSKVAVIETGTGNCHVYIDEFADLNMALKIVLNAKLSRPSVCNAVESLLVHEKIASTFLKSLKVEFDKYGVEILGCKKTKSILGSIKIANEMDYATEFLDYKISIKIVANVDEAINHIEKYSSHHSEAIVTSSQFVAEKFLNEVDSAVVYVNASTRFTDGFEFGFGSEIGISTQKLHARGPMGFRNLTSTKFIVRGDGQIRE